MGSGISGPIVPYGLFKRKLVCRMITCEESKTICSKNQYKEASWSERFNMYLHVLMCKTCFKFSRKNTKLTGLCNEASLQALTDTEKSELKKKLDQNS